MDAFAEHGIDESNSESDDEQLARSMATVDLDDEPDDGKAERKSSRAAVSGSVAAAQHSRKRRRKPEVVQPATSPHQLDWYKGCEGYACDICGEPLGDRVWRVRAMPRREEGRCCCCCGGTLDTDTDCYEAAGVHRPRPWPARCSHCRSSCALPSLRLGCGDGCHRGGNEQLCIAQIQREQGISYSFHATRARLLHLQSRHKEDDNTWMPPLHLHPQLDTHCCFLHTCA